MDFETEVCEGRARVRGQGSPAEVAAYTLALAALSNGENGAGGPGEWEREMDRPRLFAMAGVESDPAPLPPAPAPSASPSPPPAPAPSSSGPTIDFGIPGRVYEILAAAYPLSELGEIRSHPAGPGTRYHLYLTHDAAVTLYEWLQELLERGLGTRTTQMYVVKKELRAVLDREFGVKE